MVKPSLKLFSIKYHAVFSICNNNVLCCMANADFNLLFVRVWNSRYFEETQAGENYTKFC